VSVSLTDHGSARKPLEELAMKSIRDDSEVGVVLLIVLVLLTVFGVVGLTFTFYASEKMCEQNPTAELRDGTCVRTVGTDRR